MHRISLLFLLLVPSVLCTLCTEPDFDELSGDLELKGTVYIQDSFQGPGYEMPLPLQRVQLKFAEDSNTLNYFYGDESDSNGNFHFTNLSPVNYYLYAEKTVNGVVFAQGMTVSAGQAGTIKLVLRPTASGYNILNLTFRDSATNGALPGTRACIFNNSLVAAANHCEGNIITGLADINGRFITSRLAAGWYYINARDSVGNIDLKARDSIQLGATGIFSKTVYL